MHLTDEEKARHGMLMAACNGLGCSSLVQMEEITKGIGAAERLLTEIRELVLEAKRYGQWEEVVILLASQKLPEARAVVEKRRDALKAFSVTEK